MLSLGSVALSAALAFASERELVVMVEEQSFGTWQPLLELARDFEREHPGVRVRVLDLGGAAGAQDRFKFMLAGDLPLDVVRIDVTELAAYVHEGALEDLRPHLDALAGFDAGAYFPGPFAALSGARGEQFGLPSTFTPYVMYLNLDLLAAAGVERPAADWTWDDFLAAARATTRDLDGDGRIDQYGISLTQWLQAIAPWIWQAGGELLDEGFEHSALDEPGARRALAFLRALLHEERVASFDASFANQLTQGLFQAGRAAMYGPVGYWETYRFQHLDAFRWDVAPLPCDARAATAIAMTAFVVPRTSRHPALAAEFVLALASERYQSMLARIGNGVPGLERAARSEAFLDPRRLPASEHVFLDVLADARLLPPSANWRKIESICKAEIEGILYAQEIDVDAACARMARRTDEYLAHERARRTLAPMGRFAIELALGAASIALLALFVTRRGARPGRLARREERAGYALIAPWAAGFLLFLFGPAVVAFVLSLGEWSPLRELDDLRWVGLDNYARLAGDATFRTSLGVTLAYAALSVPLSLALALALALLLRRTSSATSVVRTLCYVPAIVSPVVVAAIWRSLLDADDGLANRALATLGIDGPDWLRDPHWVLPSFVLIALWSVGAQMLVFVAALQALDPAAEEAARIDGAGALARFRHVTLPALSPVVLFNLVTGLVAATQLFAQPYVMTEGGPGDASRFLVLYLYESAFRHLDMGYAAAIAMVLFALLALVCTVLMASSKRWVHYAGRSGA